MKTANQILNAKVLTSLQARTHQQPPQATQRQNLTQPQGQAQISNRDASFINQLLEQLRVIFPATTHTLKTQQQITEFKQVWTQALVESNTTQPQQIERGLRKARQQNSNFLPSCGTFINWCKPQPEDFGCLSFEASYRQATVPYTQDAAVLFVLSRLDNLTKFKLGTDEDGRKTWLDAWQRLGVYLERGGKIPPVKPKAALPPPPAADFKNNRRRIQQLQQLLSA